MFAFARLGVSHPHDAPSLLRGFAEQTSPGGAADLHLDLLNVRSRTSCWTTACS